MIDGTQLKEREYERRRKEKLCFFFKAEMITQPSDSFPSMIETLEGHSLLIPRVAKWFLSNRYEWSGLYGALGLSEGNKTDSRTCVPRLLQPWTTKHKRGYFVIFDLMHYGSFRSLFFPYSAKISPSSYCFVTVDSREKTSKKRSPNRIRRPNRAMQCIILFLMASRPAALILFIPRFVVIILLLSFLMMMVEETRSDWTGCWIICHLNTSLR